MSTMSLVVMVCSKVSAVSSTVAMLGAPRSGVLGRSAAGGTTPGGAFSPGADRCGTPAPPHIIPIRHDGDVPHTLTGALDAVLDGLPADPLRRATASLIDAYRSGAPPTAQVLRDPTTAAAYAAYRMPATHAAVSRALRHATDLAPGSTCGRWSTWAVAPARRRGRWRRRSPRWSGPRCSTGRPTRWRSAPGSGGTARRSWRVPRGRGRCSGRV